MKLGFVGLGAMGAPMAKNLIEAGHELAVWNRTGGRDGALVGAGARRASGPADAARGAGAVVTPGPFGRSCSVRGASSKGCPKGER